MANVTQEKHKRTVYMRDGGPGRQYIGLTRYLEKRQRAHHNNCKRGESKALYEAVRNHPDGWDAFPLRILMETEPITDFQASAVEVWHIHFYNTYENGLNETRGGFGLYGYVPSDAMRAKLLEYWTPENKSAHSAKMLEAGAKPEVKARRSDAQRERFKRPDEMEKHCRRIKQFAPVVAEKNREHWRKERMQMLPQIKSLRATGMSWEKIAKTIGKDYRTLMRWNIKFREEGIAVEKTAAERSRELESTKRPQAKELREQGLTMQAVADKLGVSLHMVWKWENDTP